MSMYQLGNPSLSRRHALFAVLGAGVSMAVAGQMGVFSIGKGDARSATGTFPYQLSDAQWRKKLPAEAYNVLRHEDTERAYTSPLNKEKRKGTFVCRGCDHQLFSSATKYESGTGWPSFYRPLKGGIGTATDHKLGYARTEVHCANCGGHLGHVFNDGPKPTGKRYCMNGVAMRFIPA